MPAIRIGLFLQPCVYSKAFIGHKSRDTPFSSDAYMALWYQGQALTCSWPTEKRCLENDKL